MISKTPRRSSKPLLIRLAGAGLILVSLAACMESTGAGALAPGLTASMAEPGASLDRVQALDIINQYRASVGAPALTADNALDTTAQSLAGQYAATGKSPKLPDGATAIRASAGYTNFAETFSGWRNSPADASVLASASAHRAGVAAVYQPNSDYGSYWVLVLGG